ncbi:MAG TPA: DNA alkylation repair protein [Thermoanaerobaculia bacterium]|nr:DNA alkylation repair protein [Thermoanaerobaculia bacterium]
MASSRNQLATIRERLRAQATPGHAEAALRYFKDLAEGDQFLGVRVPGIRAVVRDCDALTLEELSTLLDSDWHEERTLALLSLGRRYAKRADERDAIYALYLAKTDRVNNWDLVDCSAEHIVGAHLRERSRAPLRKLAKSTSVWERRIAIVATLHYIRRGEFEETLRIIPLLAGDKHHLIRKAIVWMRREITKRQEKARTSSAARTP